jgi:hypothetical protein
MESSREQPSEPTNPTDLSCEDCGKTFSTPMALESHSSSVHGSDGATSKADQAPPFNRPGGRADPVKETGQPRGSSDHDNGRPESGSRPSIKGANANSPGQPRDVGEAWSDAKSGADRENREPEGENQGNSKANAGWVPRDPSGSPAKGGASPKDPKDEPTVKESKEQVPSGKGPQTGKDTNEPQRS